MSSQQEPRPPARPPEPVPQGPQGAGGAVEPAVGPAAPEAPPVSGPDQQQPGRDRVPHSRVGTIWIGIGAAALIMIALIVFLLQNTTTVEVAFLGFEGSLPLAVALLIAWVTGVLLTLIVGTARIAQLRRLDRRRRSQTSR